MLTLFIFFFIFTAYGIGIAWGLAIADHILKTDDDRVARKAAGIKSGGWVLWSKK